MLPVIRWMLSELYPAEIDAEQFRGLADPHGRSDRHPAGLLRENIAFLRGGIEKRERKNLL